MSKPLLGIVLGDTTGIGPEIVARAWAENKIAPYCIPVLIGDARVLEMGKRIAGVKFPAKIIENVSQMGDEGNAYILDQNNIDPDEVKPGEINAISGKASGDDVVAALELCRTDSIKGFVYAPLNKAALQQGGYHFKDEHHLMVDYLNWQGPYGEVNVVKGLWTSRVTGHLPIKDISNTLSVENVLRAIRLIHQMLLRAKIRSPRIAVAALNPHGGEDGLCGREEKDIIAPAVYEARKEKLDVQGPYPADTIFIHAFDGAYDAVVTMYHDQGQIALKLMQFQSGVTVAAGLPYSITTPAHGTAFDIAGKGVARTDAFEQAVKIASLMV